MNEVSFQWENHPKCTLQRASNWCQHNKVNVLKYSAQPPGLTYWRSAIMPQAPCPHKLGPCCWCAWALEAGGDGAERIHKGVHRNLIGSMPRGIGAVIEAKGGNPAFKHKNWFVDQWSLYQPQDLTDGKSR